MAVDPPVLGLDRFSGPFPIDPLAAPAALGGAGPVAHLSWCGIRALAARHVEVTATPAMRRASPMADPFPGGIAVPPDWRAVHPSEANRPEESRRPWDCHRLVRAVAAEPAIRPMAGAHCRDGAKRSRAGSPVGASLPRDTTGRHAHADRAVRTRAGTGRTAHQGTAAPVAKGLLAPVVEAIATSVRGGVGRPQIPSYLARMSYACDFYGFS